MSKEKLFRKRSEPYIFIVVLFFITIVGTACLSKNSYGHVDTQLIIKETTKRIERDPKNAELYVYRGYLYLLQHDWKFTLSDLDKAERISKGKLSVIPLLRAKAWLLAGKLSQNKELEHDRLNTALDQVNAFIQEDPEHVEGAIVKSEVLALSGKYKEATDLHEELIGEFHLHPGPSYYMQQADWLVADKRSNEAVDFLDIGTKQLGNVFSLHDKAIGLEVEMGKFDSALKRVDILLARPGRKEKSLVKKADILLSAGRKKEAHKLYNEALSLINALSGKSRNKATKDLENYIQRKLKLTGK